jgi:hypothetical protein
MRRSAILVALAIVLAMATTACAADKKEEAKANTQIVVPSNDPAMGAATKQPTLPDYQSALTVMQGKAQAYKQIEDGLRQAILNNEIQALKIQEKIVELTPKPPAKP